MCLCHRFTGIATLIIGLQLFNPMLIDINLELGKPHKISSNPSFVASNTKASPKLALTNQSNHPFNPPDNQGPDNTLGSGTR